MDVHKPPLQKAIHDAESIFWVIVFFMICANPKGSDTHKLKWERSEIFDIIMGHKIGYLMSPHVSILTLGEKSWEKILPEKLQRFSGTLCSFSCYFNFPWHGIQVPVTHQFHAHNFLQWLRFHEIKQLTKEMEDGIQHSIAIAANTTVQELDTIHVFPEPAKKTVD